MVEAAKNEDAMTEAGMNEQEPNDAAQKNSIVAYVANRYQDFSGWVTGKDKEGAASDLHQSLLPLMRVGAVVVFVFFGVFGGWAALAPLSSAAIAPGKVSPEGSRRTVQHLEGGIIAEIHARDGDKVAAGQALIKLQEIQSLSRHQVLVKERAALTAVSARLSAEQAGLDTLAYPDWLDRDAAASPDLQTILESQNGLFETRQRTYESQKSIVQKRVAQLNEEISGFEAQIDSQNAQKDLLETEIADVQQLLEEGLARRPRLLELQRHSAQIEERIAANKSAIARANQEVGAAELEIASMDSARLDQIGEELVRVSAQLAEVNEKLTATSDVLSRTVISAPASGTVMSSRYKSAGGVIAAGETILEIVPDQDELIIEAQVSPMDIDVVQLGLTAKVLFPGLTQRGLPQLTGEVVAISADVLTDKVSGATYYSAQVRVSDEAYEKLGPMKLSPGMVADVQIVTGARTPLQYLLEPLTGLFRRGFKET